MDVFSTVTRYIVELKIKRACLDASYVGTTEKAREALLFAQKKLACFAVCMALAPRL